MQGLFILLDIGNLQTILIHENIILRNYIYMGMLDPL